MLTSIQGNCRSLSAWVCMLTTEVMTPLFQYLGDKSTTVWHMLEICCERVNKLANAHDPVPPLLHAALVIRQLN